MRILANYSALCKETYSKLNPQKKKTSSKSRLQNSVFSVGSDNKSCSTEREAKKQNYTSAASKYMNNAIKLQNCLVSSPTSRLVKSPSLSKYSKPMKSLISNNSVERGPLQESEPFKAQKKSKPSASVLHQSTNSSSTARRMNYDKKLQESNKKRT
jgi:hypothetical protein